LTVDPALVISPSQLPVATVGNAFKQQLTAGGGTNHGYSFTAIFIPSWLKLSAAGLLTGVPPSTPGSPFSITVKVTDSLKATGTASYSLTVDPALTLNPSTLPAATVGNLFSVPLAPGGGSGTGYNFTAIGLPAWLKLSAGGLLNGTPTAATTSSLRFTITVTDSAGGTFSRTYSLGVSAGPAVHRNQPRATTAADAVFAGLADGLTRFGLLMENILP
jgi:hypothetical protein